MIEYYAGDARRIHHFLKVHSFAKLIGEMEGVTGEELEILEVAALVHDIGIKNSEKKYGYNTGKTQEKEGPPEAEKLLIPLTDDAAFIERVCYLVGHHHTYSNIDGMDYQILVEADFLVNLYEDKSISKQSGLLMRRSSGHSREESYVRRFLHFRKNKEILTDF
jgi:uncharacterized protein